MCRKWSITLVTLVILAASKKLDLEASILYMIVSFAGAYIGLQGFADVKNAGARGSTLSRSPNDAEHSTPPA